MRLRSWKQLEELINFVQAAGFDEPFKGGKGYSSASVVGYLKEEADKSDLNISDIKVYVFDERDVINYLEAGYENIRHSVYLRVYFGTIIEDIKLYEKEEEMASILRSKNR